jgi:hypothetical protein
MLQRPAVADAHEGFRASQEALRVRSGRCAASTIRLGALLAAARHYLALPRERPQSWLLVAILLGDPRPLLSDEEARRTAPLLLAFLADVRALFDEAAAEGVLAPGDATMRTLAFWASLQGAMSLEKARRLAPDLPSAEVVGGATVRTLLLGWGAPPQVLVRAERWVSRDGEESEEGSEGR